MFDTSQPSRKGQKRQSYLLLFLFIMGSLMLTTNEAEAQQPWRAIKQATKKYDKAVRDAQRTQDQYNKRVYRQQEKLIRQNEQAIKKYYRTGTPAAVIVPYEPAPVLLYPAEVIVPPPAMPIGYPITVSPIQTHSVSYSSHSVTYPAPTISYQAPTVAYPASYPSVISNSVVNESTFVEQPFQSNLSHTINNGEWLPMAAPAESMPAYQGEIVYEDSQPYVSGPVYGEVVTPMSTAVSSGTPTPAQQVNVQVETSVSVETSGDGEPTLAPIPDAAASGFDDDLN